MSGLAVTACLPCAQLTERRLQEQEQQQRQREEEEEARSAWQRSQELVQREAASMAERGYQGRVGDTAAGNIGSTGHPEA